MGKRIDGKFNLSKIKGKHISEAEIQAINLVIEKAKVKRERASLILNKGMTLYFSFLIVAVLGLTYQVIQQKTFDSLVFMGFAVLLAGGFPYLQLMKKSEQDIDDMLDYLFE